MVEGEEVLKQVLQEQRVAYPSSEDTRRTDMMSELGWYSGSEES
jgi:hypothetical protein